jgi:hypothetical protein
MGTHDRQSAVRAIVLTESHTDFEEVAYIDAEGTAE